MQQTKTYNWEKDFEEIVEKISKYANPNDSEKEILKRAFEFGAKAHEGQLCNGAISKLPYITHPIRTIKILLQVQPDLDTIVATILHGVLYHTEIKKEKIEQEFGSNVAFLCEKMIKIWPLTLMPVQGNNDYLKKLFIAIAEDVRVIYIQLADIIDNLQQESFANDTEKKHFTENAIHLYAPIAQKLNLYYFKNQLEDYGFKNLNPEIYENIKSEINANRKQRQRFIDQSIKAIEKALESEKIPFLEVYGRPKNFYSIYLKMKRKNYSSAKDIYDLFALRIITNKESNCYRALGAIHAHWKPLPHRFKDYIAVPKQNGYQSLHTTILGLLESTQPTEIQIKTEDMNQMAEFGSAAHWAYKKRRGSHFNEEFLEKNEWVTQGAQEPEEIMHNLSQSVFEERIHTFTPKGEIKHLPKGGTPIDFAYAIHSQVGDTTIGAKVNGKIKPLNHELKPGDVVEIMTKSGKHPNPLWLKFVKSSQAKGKIRNYLNKLESTEEKKDPEAPKALAEKPIKTKLPKVKKEIIETPYQKSSIVIGGTKTKSYKLPKCCKARPYQDIIAYNSRGLEFAIHRKDCKMIPFLEEERMLDANFLRYLKFQIKADDRVGILTEITDCIAENDINTLVCNHKVTQKDQVEFNFEIEYIHEQEIKSLFEQLQKIPNVIEIIECTPTKKAKAKKS